MVEKIKLKIMFNLFKKQSPLEKLQKKHQALMEEVFHLSKTDRVKSDQKYSEAEEVASQIEALQKKDS